jgi:glucose-6-phosphate 1-dehydrogenase
VPFYLRTGKRLAVARLGNRHLSSSDPAFDLFSARRPVTVPTTELVIRLQPNEGVKQWIMIKDPGPGGMRLQQVPLDMTLPRPSSRAQSGRL